MKIAYLFILLPTIALSQSIKGNYRYFENSTIHQINLLDSAKFLQNSGKLQWRGRHVEKGSYSIKGDTLILQFEPFDRPKGKMKTLDKASLEGVPLKNDFKDETWINLHLFNANDSTIIPPTTVIDLISNDSIIATVAADNNGKFNFYSSNTIINELNIRSVGYDDYNLVLDDLRGYVTSLQVSLIPNNLNTFGKKSGKEKYVIGKGFEYVQLISEDGSLGAKYVRVPEGK